MKKCKKKGILNEFKEFILRGNVIDMAIGVIIATAFGKITTSIVNDVFMPFIGWLIGGFDLSKLNIVLEPDVVDKAGNIVTPGVTIGIGILLVNIINFLIIAAIVFMMIKVFAKARELSEKARFQNAEPCEEVVEEKAPTSEELLAQILEEIKKK